MNWDLASLVEVCKITIEKEQIFNLATHFFIHMPIE
jgi:hypothetical protein